MTQLEIYKRQLEIAKVILENSKDDQKETAQELYDLCKKRVGKQTEII